MCDFECSNIDESNPKKLKKETKMEQNSNNNVTNGVNSNEESNAMGPLDVEEEADLVEMDEKCKQEIRSKMQSFQDHVNSSFDMRMHTLGRTYEEQSRNSVSQQQLGLIKLNKIIREIARLLGPEWFPVFEHLVKDIPREIVENELIRIENQKPFMQAYTALTTWRDICGEEVNIMDLALALEASQKGDLAEKVIAIMESEGDVLHKDDSYGKGIRSGSIPGARPPSMLFMNGSASDIDNNHTDHPESTNAIESSVSVSDGILLKISKRIDQQWYDLGVALGVEEEELKDISSEDTRMGHEFAFRMLHSWRESSLDNGGNLQESLKTALSSVGFEDLCSLIS